MRLLPNGNVVLEKGEPVPVFCRCAAIYQPRLHSEWSRCPDCGRENVHGTCDEWGLNKERKE
jgi:hypothetical protein